MVAGALAAGILLMSMLFISSIFCCANAVDAPNAAARTNVVMATLFMGISVSEGLKEMGVSIREDFLNMSLTAGRAPAVASTLQTPEAHTSWHLTCLAWP